VPDNNSNTTYLITEFNPAKGDGMGGQYPPTATLYGGIYAAEYVMRQSTLTQMLFVGSYQLLNPSGINDTNDYFSVVKAAYDAGQTTNTTSLDYGFYLTAQVAGEAVAFGALTHSTALYATTVGTNGPTVASDTNSVSTIPALYAQAYQGANGRRCVVLTNKGSNSVPVQIFQDGVRLTNQFTETYVTGGDPSVTNSPPPSSAIQIQTGTTTNPVTIPEYSVVRLEWTVFAIPQTALSLTVSNSTQYLQWPGLTNVVYSVQATTNLLSDWSTIGRIANTQTNFSFTNWYSGPQQFYRLAVP